MDRRSQKRRADPDVAVKAALGLVLATDPRATDRRRYARRRGDAPSVRAMLAGHCDEIVKTFALGGSRDRRSAQYHCGCVVVDPVRAHESMHLLECPTHAALQANLRRRRTDRHEGYAFAKT